ncbi:MAG: hypothetical protein R3301_08165, partial [Saprospiraceae bacterium]|nr:hypothetical protein [Saprospiraceae bacterium]
DEAAIAFAVSFYRRLMRGDSIRKAYHHYDTEFRISGKSTRGVRRKETGEHAGPPWRLHVRPGADAAAEWNIATSTGNPLFNLDIVGKYALPPEPYRSLRRYEESHARIFFGRGREIRALFNLLTDPGRNAIVQFHGPSGAGKSSLLDAGLVPRVKDKLAIHYLRREGNIPLDTLLSDRLTQLGGDLTSGLRNAWIDIEQTHDRPLVIIVDQVEEVITRPLADDVSEMDRFVRMLQDILTGDPTHIRGKIVLAYREGYHGRIDAALREANLDTSPFLLTKLDRTAIKQAVLGIVEDPVLKEQYQLHIDADLADAISIDLEDDRQGATAPVLQILMHRMWKSIPVVEGERHFTLDQYRTLRQSGEILAHFIRQQLEAMAATEPNAVASGLVLDILWFFTTPDDTSDQHTIEDLQERYGADALNVQALCEELDRRFLLSGQPVMHPEQPQVQTTYRWRLTHDTLAPKIRRMFAESPSPGQQAHRLLENLPENWRGNTDENLFNRQQTEVLTEGRPAMRVWTQPEIELYDLSRKRLEQADRNRRYRVMAAIGLGTAILLLGWFLFAQSQKTNRLMQAQVYEQEADRLPHDPGRQLTLLSRSIALNPDELTIQRWYDIYRENVFGDTLRHDTSVYKAAISPDGKYVAMARQQGAGFPVYLYRLDNGRLDSLGPMESIAGNRINHLQFSGDSKFLHAGGSDRRLHTWNLNRDSLQNHDLERVITAFGVSDDGRLGLIAYQDALFLELRDLFTNERVDSIWIGQDCQKVDGGYMDATNDRVFAITFDAEDGRFRAERIYCPALLYQPASGALTIDDGVASEVYFALANLYPAADRELALASRSRTLTLFAAEHWHYQLRAANNLLYTIDDDGLLQRWTLRNHAPLYSRDFNDGEIGATGSVGLQSASVIYASTRLGVLSVSLPDGTVDTSQAAWGRIVSAMHVDSVHIVAGTAEGDLLLFDRRAWRPLWQGRLPNPETVVQVGKAAGEAMVYASQSNVVATKSIDGDTSLRHRAFADGTWIDGLDATPRSEALYLLQNGLIKTMDAARLAVLDSTRLRCEVSNWSAYFALLDRAWLIASDDSLFIASPKGTILKRQSAGDVITRLATHHSSSYFALLTWDNRVLVGSPEGYLFHRIPTNDAENVTALSVYEDLLVLGTSEGRVEVWKIPPPPPAPVAWLDR